MKIKKLYPEIFLVEKKFNRNKIYYYLQTPNNASIIAKNNNKFLVVSQKRIPINKTIFEFPGGIIEKNTSSKKTAIKELYEETGYKCINSPNKLLSIYPDPGRLDCQFVFYFTDKIKKINKPETGINLHLLTKNQILRLINNQKFSHASHAYAFLSYLNKKKLNKI